MLTGEAAIGGRGRPIVLFARRRRRRRFSNWMSISQVTWPALGQLDISDENSRVLVHWCPEESTSLPCTPIEAREEPASNPRHRSLTTVRDDDERSRRDDVSQNCPRRREFDRPVSDHRRTLDERLTAAGSNLRFQDRRIADLEARLTESANPAAASR